jgi:hypothetical protein
MTSRPKWALLPGIVALAGVVALLSAYSGASSSQGFAPEQPIKFPHPRHVQTLGMNCVYCHYAATKSPEPGIPAVGTCMGCHTLIGPNRPKVDSLPARNSAAIAKLQKYAADKQAIRWVRIHKLPEYVHFPHVRHVSAGVTCQTCHGPIQAMEQVYQFASLNMGWCVSCHVNGYKVADGKRAAGLAPTAEDLAAAPKKARYDCAICHF